MKKKIATAFYMFILLIMIFGIQLFVFDSRTLLGIKPNLILIATIVISAWYGEKIGGIFSFILGVITDFLFRTDGVFVISYTLIGIVVGLFNHKYNKENRISLVYITIIATFLLELLQYISYVISYQVFSNVFYFLKQIAIASVFNIVIVFVVYSIIYHIVTYFDNRQRKDLSGF